MTQKHDVFISYATPDKTTADTICHFLEAEGVRCWIAPRDIPPGENFGKFIPEALREVALMVLVFSSNANSSEYVQDEVALAAKYKRVIIPFRVEDVQPQQGLEFHLARRNWLDALTPPLAGHVRSLVG
ncbi:MAG TPA: toll/interleukin-1 receptor domain-containing protein, partial [Candidatus Hydrogenedentes bacterium]|nr:toll/interleukin-1 receptor domain-containing protein [Candidatus Hydrogenedentota bacterium]